MEFGEASEVKPKSNKSAKAVPGGPEEYEPQPREWILPVFQFNDYVDFLRSVVTAQDHLRGVKSKLATAAKCQPSYFTQVLQSEAHLSLDQLYGIATYLKLTDAEWEYLKELWLLSRIATRELRETCEKRMGELRKKYGGTIGAADHNVQAMELETIYLFGTSWQHGAIYVGLAIPGLNTVDTITKRFGMSAERARQVLQDLETMGLAAQEPKGVWKKTSKNFTMDRRSTACQLYRTAWYMKGMQNFFDDPSRNAHSGACFAINKKQIPELEERAREILYELFRDGDPGPKDTVVYFGFDMFEV